MTLDDLLILFGAALVAAMLVRLLRAPAIIGFLFAGIVIGPSGFGWITAAPEGHGQLNPVQFLAELGLTLLLFTVGLELSPEPLFRMGRRLVVAAGVQIGLTALGVGAIFMAFAAKAFLPAVIIGIAVALSSTAIVLKQLSDRGETDSPAGTLTTGILLLQDIAVILLMILLPLFAQSAGGQWLPALGKMALSLGALVAVTLAGRKVIPWLVYQVSRHGGQELLTLFAIVMAAGGAWLAHLADWSWALGSCIAGLLLAQTEMRHQLRAEITPFRDAFNALFFISIGMLVDLQLVVENPGLLLVAVLATLLFKTIVTAGAVAVSGWPLRLSLIVGLGLCSMSEFGFVLAHNATDLGLLQSETFNLLVAWAVGTMLIGALLVPLAGEIAAFTTRRLQPDAGAADETVTVPHDHPKSHVIVIGYGINGSNLARVLRATAIPYVVVEMNPAGAARARAEGGTVLVGDATRAAILAHAGLADARALVIAIADSQAVRRIVAQAHAARPDLYILARTRFVADLDQLYRLGARQVIPEEFETSIEIFAHVLKEFAIPDNVVDQQVKMVRAGRYGMLRGRTADRTLRSEWMRILEAAVTQTCLLHADSPACGRTVRQLDLRARTGVTIVAVTRGGKATTNPAGEFRLEPGDVLVLVGTHRQLDRARSELNPPAETAPV